MKSEFALAFNQICSEYNLPREVVLDAVRAALATAYRRDWKVPPNQNVSADINLDTGLAKIYLEQVVVESVENKLLEINLKDALKIDHHVEVGDPVMVDVTPRNFGRIAAQTAKQVITQRLREAERESQYNRFSRQEGEIIIGTVQSITPHGVTLHLERTEEAHMPKREQIPGERYMLHQKIRVYVVEVRRTPRGPEITVSRSHPNMLRRMLELEVPEIRNGQVEIKAIAREAGTRAKVAVTSRQPGLDPVGACVGMRGIRIQTISHELHGERVDVVEWDKDVSQFIANALSIQPVMAVLLDEDRSGQGARTASVVVLDDQLSLAIGRSGQNARLAAKLTNWRIDIQGVTEAALWALEQVNRNPDLIDWLDKDVAPLVPRLASIMRAHEKDRYPYTDEELQAIKGVVVGVHQTLLDRRRAARERIRQAEEAPPVQVDPKAQKRARLAEARASVPSGAYQLDLEVLSLSGKVMDHLTQGDIENVGEIMERMALGDEALLIVNGIGSKALKEIKHAVAQMEFAEPEPEEEEAPSEEIEPAEISEEVPAVSAESEEPGDEVLAEKEVDVVPLAPEEAEEALPETEKVVTEPAAAESEAAVTEAVDEGPSEEGVEAEDLEAVQPVEEPTADVAEEPEQEDDEADELTEGFSLEDLDGVSVGDYDFEETEENLEEEILDQRGDKGGKHKKSKRRRRTIIYDEESGETFVVRKRRQGRYQEGWDEY
jgi:N utilization substance protein A